MSRIVIFSTDIEWTQCYLFLYRQGANSNVGNVPLSSPVFFSSNHKNILSSKSSKIKDDTQFIKHNTHNSLIVITHHWTQTVNDSNELMGNKPLNDIAFVT